MSSPMIKRHTRIGIFMHWFNAVLWFFLLATGLGLIQNPALQPLGSWYPQALRELFGSGAALLRLHWGVGAIWALGWLLYAVFYGLRHVLPFMRDIFTLSPGRDLQWMLKKNIQMTLGSKVMAKLAAKLGWDAKMPDQGYYNAGQKVAAQAMVLGGLVLVASGVVMVLSKYVFDASWAPLVQWSILIHYAAAGFSLAVILVHVYMAAISKEERPAFFSMFTGKVPQSYAEHHHKLWLRQICD